MKTDDISHQLLGDELELLCDTSLLDIQNLLSNEGMLCNSNLQFSNVNTGNSVFAQAQKLAPCYDSRLLQPHHIFVALSGENFDGHQFIGQALDAGVKAIVFQSELEPELSKRIRDLQGQVAAFWVNHSRQALSLLSAHCFGYPSHKIRVLGITGTDGKTSIAYLTYQILSANHREKRVAVESTLGDPSPVGVGLLSTFGVDLGWGLAPNPVHQTTPESLIVQRALARMLANGCRFAVLECSSHGLSPKTARLLHVEFRAALFTNLSPEHLEFHGSMECYACDKARLFRSLRTGGAAIWNHSEPAAEMLHTASGSRCDIVHWGYGLSSEPPGEPGALAKDHLSELRLPAQSIPYAQIFQAENLSLGIATSHFDIVGLRPQAAPSFQHADPKFSCAINIPSSAYVSNVLGALSLCYAVSKPDDSGTLEYFRQILQNVAYPEQNPNDTRYTLNLKAPKGRMELIPNEAPFTVLIDYAHSPGSFSRLLPEMRTLLQQASDHTEARRLLVLFGSGGQRDRQKRPTQGALAARYANVIVLCNEDPREEDEMAILQDIRAGICSAKDFVTDQNLFLIPNRRQAMAQIFALAQSGDLVLLLGKGHESSIILKNHREIPWDEREVALELLRTTAQAVRCSASIQVLRVEPNKLW